MMSIDSNKSQLSSYNKKGLGIQEAYEQIKHLIAINQLIPGQKLIYKDLAKKTNKGVTPIIQALNRLVASGIVRYETNKGYFVGEVTEKEIRQLYQAREALETYIIPDVIRNIDSEKLNAIRQSFQNCDNVRLSRRELILQDTHFHLAIARYAHNDVIYRLLEGIFEQVYLKYRPEYLDDDRVIVTKGEHRDILRFLDIKDVDKTIALIKDHIRTGMEYVITTIKAEKDVF